jgi:hypothetical protein
VERRMLDCCGLDAEISQIIHQFLLRFRHLWRLSLNSAGLAVAVTSLRLNKNRAGFPVAIRSLFRHIAAAAVWTVSSGCSSGVEHNLAKVRVEGSNPFARSKFQIGEKHPGIARIFCF